MINARLKSLFVLPAAAISAVLVIGSIDMALEGNHDRLAWWGAALANLPLPTLLGLVMVSGRARTSEDLPLGIFAASVGTVTAIWVYFVEGVGSWFPLAVAGTGMAILLLYLYWYSKFGRIAVERLSVGNKLPEFSLRNASGKLFGSAEIAGAPAVLIFFRGNWCPFCMAQIQEVVDRYKDLESLGTKVAMISPQSDAQSQRLAAKFDVPIEFLVDEGNSFARELGIAVDNGVPLGVPGRYDPETVMPTVVVANAAGTIIFSDQTDNYRVRPEPDVFLAILRRADAITE